jgi:hypothetical protein
MAKVWEWILNRLIVIGVVIFILVGILVIVYLKKEGFSCAVNPIRFYELKYNSSCFCTG